jgi:hypothetical protein
MKTLGVIALLLVLTASAVAAYGNLNIAEVGSAVSHGRATEPAQLLLCGAVLLAMSVAVRRATFVVHKR